MIGKGELRLPPQSQEAEMVPVNPIQTCFFFATCLVVGDLGYRVARRARVPSPALIGSMLAVGLASSAGVSLPGLMPVLRTGLQVVIGTVLGLRISREFADQLKRMAGPAVVVSLWAVVTGLSGGMLLGMSNSISRATALFAATPGGISEMTLAAASFGAHTPTVAALQLARVVGVLLVVPALVNGRAEVAATTVAPVPARVAGPVQTLALLATSGAGALFLQARGVPAGALVGAMTVTAASGLWKDRGRRSLHPAIVHWSQVGIGMTVGLSFTSETFAQLVRLVAPALLLNGIMLASGVALAHLLHRWTGWDMVTCLLASAPAGLSQMGILSEALGANVGVVSVLHIIRLVTVISVLLPLLGAVVP